MNLAKYKYYILGGLAFFLLWLTEVMKPQPVDWSESFSKDHSRPYGCFVLFERLPDLFSGDVKAQRNEFIWSLAQENWGNAIVVTDDFQPEEDEIRNLLDYVSSGNKLFVASRSLHDKFQDTLSVSVEYAMYLQIEDTVEVTVNRTDSVYSYSSKTTVFTPSIIDTDSLNKRKGRYTELGQLNDSLVNFVSIGFGKGTILLHCQPELFTNYHMLKHDNHLYVSAVLSHLPGGNILWDEQFKPGRFMVQQSPLTVFLQVDGFRESLYFLLFGVFLYMIFASKRKQRVIPVIEPKENATVDFTQTIGRLYYNSGANQDIGLKQIEYFLADVRKHYMIPTALLNDKFAERLHNRSQVSLHKVEELVTLMNIIRGVKDVSGSRIMQLDAKLEDFYLSAGISRGTIGK